jgi:hypothetical protein
VKTNAPSPPRSHIARTRLFIRGCTPEEAAERAATEYNNSHRPKWVRNK